MSDNDGPIVSVAMPGRASVVPDDDAHPSAGDHKPRRTMARKSIHAEPEAPLDAPQHQLDSLA